MNQGVCLLCPAGETDPVLLEADLSLAISSPRPRWFRQLVRTLELEWGMELWRPLEMGEPLILSHLGFEAWWFLQQQQQQQEEALEMEIPAELVF